MTIEELVRASHELSVSKGWYETWPDGLVKSHAINVPEKLALIHSEISEALESYRDHGVRSRCPDCNGDGKCPFGGAAVCWKCQGVGFLEIFTEKMERDAANARYVLSGKPEGFVVELADTVIRIGDLCGALGLDLSLAISVKHEYNATRPHRHGGKRC